MRTIPTVPYDTEVMRRDVYPAEIVMPDGELITGVHAFVTSHRVLLYSEIAHREIALTHDLPLAVAWSVPGDRNTLRQGHLQLDLQDGGTAWLNAGSGCGCGSPLKSMDAPVSWTGR